MRTRSLKQRAAFISLITICLFGCRKVDENESSVKTQKPQAIKTKYGVEMVLIPAGWFDMGSDNDSADEAPVHKVWIDAFLMDTYEVTQDQYRKFELSDPSHFQGAGLPVEQRTWIDAVRFCNERSYQEGLEPCYNEETGRCNFQANGYRLPTEAEWEYACRAGTKSEYFFGNDPRQLKKYTWYSDNAFQKTHQVGTKNPNPWGLYDMYGNVAEWCHDFFVENYYKDSPPTNPLGPDQGVQRVLRGGAWNSSAESCRSAYRTGNASIDDDCLISDDIGFRCVRRIPDHQ